VGQEEIRGFKRYRQWVGRSDRRHEKNAKRILFREQSKYFKGRCRP
jgi:hypothetical protein